MLAPKPQWGIQKLNDFIGARRLMRLAAAATLTAVAFAGVGLTPATAAPAPGTPTAEAAKDTKEPMVSAPSKVDAVRNKNGTVTMSWQPPTKIVSSRILRYIVVVHPFTNLEKRYAVSASTRKLTVKDPAPGGQLSIGVRVEAESFDKKSYPWNFHPIYFTAGKPTYTPVTGTWSKFGGNIKLASKPKVTAATSTSVSIAWPKPKLPNGTVTAVKLQAVDRISRLVETPKLSTTATSATVTRLKPNSDYYLELQIDAISADGKTKDSTWFNLAVKTTKGAPLSSAVTVGKPGNLKVVTKGRTVTVTWSAAKTTGSIEEYGVLVGDKFYSVSASTFSKTVTVPRGGEYPVLVTPSADSPDRSRSEYGPSAETTVTVK
jgi:hypothetical protein